MLIDKIKQNINTEIKEYLENILILKNSQNDKILNFQKIENTISEIRKINIPESLKDNVFFQKDKDSISKLEKLYKHHLEVITRLIIKNHYFDIAIDINNMNVTYIFDLKNKNSILITEKEKFGYILKRPYSDPLMHIFSIKNNILRTNYDNYNKEDQNIFLEKFKFVLENFNKKEIKELLLLIYDLNIEKNKPSIQDKVLNSFCNDLKDIYKLLEDNEIKNNLKI